MTLLGIDGAEFASRQGETGPGTLVHHRLTSHPLLTLDSLADLADRLPATDVEHHRGELPELLTDGEPVQLTGLGAGEMIRGIATNRCWVVLWNIEQTPAYAALLDECLAEITPHATPGEDVVLREGFVFISAPDTVTPVHIDPEHNVLLQVVGEKAMTVGRFPDETRRHRESERVVMGGLRWLREPPVDERAHELVPGLGVYVPPFTPHRVRNGSGLCVSLSVTWRTASYYRYELIYQWNARLRRLGLDPRPPGGSLRRDLAKVGAWHGARWAVRSLRRATGRPRATTP